MRSIPGPPAIMSSRRRRPPIGCPAIGSRARPAGPLPPATGASGLSFGAKRQVDQWKQCGGGQQAALDDLGAADPGDLVGVIVGRALARLPARRAPRSACSGTARGPRRRGRSCRCTVSVPVGSATMPVSSSSSRIAPSATVSPSSRTPPGNPQRPALGGCAAHDQRAAHRAARPPTPRRSAARDSAARARLRFEIRGSGLGRLGLPSRALAAKRSRADSGPRTTRDRVRAAASRN